jgi:hypothetical protein
MSKYKSFFNEGPLENVEKICVGVLFSGFIIPFIFLFMAAITKDLNLYLTLAFLSFAFLTTIPLIVLVFGYDRDLR